MNAAFPLLFKSYLERSLQAGTHLEKVLHEKLPHAHVEPLMDKILLGLLIASLGLTVMHKTVRRSAIFLLQPCHVSALALIVLLRMDPTQERTHIAFNIYLHCMWGAALALFFPDLRDYNAFLEVENFWIEVRSSMMETNWTSTFSLCFCHFIGFTLADSSYYRSTLTLVWPVSSSTPCITRLCSTRWRWRWAKT